MTQPANIVVLDADAARAAVDELGEVLADCVAGGASVSFMQPFGAMDGAEFFKKVAASVARGGWQRAGTVPDYAYWPDGGLCATTFFWKKL